MASLEPPNIAVAHRVALVAQLVSDTLALPLPCGRLVAHLASADDHVLVTLKTGLADGASMPELVWFQLLRRWAWERLHALLRRYDMYAMPELEFRRWDCDLYEPCLLGNVIEDVKVTDHPAATQGFWHFPGVRVPLSSADEVWETTPNTHRKLTQALTVAMQFANSSSFC